jgi:hypothetical protein
MGGYNPIVWRDTGVQEPYKRLRLGCAKIEVEGRLLSVHGDVYVIEYPFDSTVRYIISQSFCERPDHWSFEFIQTINNDDAFVTWSWSLPHTSFTDIAMTLANKKVSGIYDTDCSLSRVIVSGNVSDLT